MKRYSQTQAEHLINQWGGEGRPFLFVIDYRQENILLLPLDEVNEEELRFDFGRVHNGRTSPTPLTEPPLWQPQPPSLDDYRRSFNKVTAELQEGNSFLTNLTCRVPLTTSLSLADLYTHTQARYRLWWKEHFVCFSPEIFVRIADGLISAYPMKGTIAATDAQAARRLLDDPKEAAEHATIVDLIRNDLSIVASEVAVRRYRYLESIETHRGKLLQTSSEIVGRLPTDHLRRLGSLLFQLLPAGSITGAPKVKTMQIIAEAETYERGFYTGIMGVFDGATLDSAVMIRFVEQEADGTLVFKTGGGITINSRMEAEYEEMKQKVYAPLR
ncbi:aminodeoxychorismate synthase component I [Alloprevotella sp. OH1205_COT-284]|uniref:aminodeoxychorismate synthase component I n=1 Tax=Alloprevotella sp. OH1205_COT-284 TaxID=2491043 RepID=UPI000F603A06|nr:aminodeoxychorismate synthase component I [Alloprevotella sp. OH1205_COT-284]RRD79670.1 aminodeoxychorismate synthase component I [Alloprevotella sp. OH1205_COT-284]